MSEIVHYMWDPIGVCDIPEAHDEYSGYVPAIFGYVKAGDRENLRAYLRWAEGEHMGLAYNEQKAERVIESLMRWKEVLRIGI